MALGRRPRRVELRRAAIAATAIAVGLLSLLPLAYLVLSGVSGSDIATEFRYPGTLRAVGQTIALTVVISAVTVLIGVGAAVLVVRSTLPGPRLFTVVFATPLAIPGFVSAYAAYSTELVFAPRLGLTTSFGGASLIMALTLYPYVFLPCVVALRTVDPALEDVVSSLRRRRSALLLRVVLPALRPAIGGGVLIVALHVLAEFGAMEQLGRSTLTTKIMGEVLDYGDYRSARSLSLLLMALSVLVLLASGWLTGRSRRGEIARGTARPPRRWPLGSLTPVIVAIAAAVPLLAVGPTVLMTVRGLLRAGRVHASGAQVAHAQIIQALVTTLGYAVVAAGVASAVALPVAWWVSRGRSVVASLTERSVWVAHAIPSAILGLALVYLATHTVPALYKTPTVLVVSYVILFLPLAVANQRVGLGAARGTYDDVAASLGSRPLSVFARVDLRLASPGILVGALLVALDASKELNTTLMLVPYNAHTLSTRLWATTNGESLDFTAAAPYAGLLVLLGLPPVALLARHALRGLEVGPTRSTGTTDQAVPRHVVASA